MSESLTSQRSEGKGQPQLICRRPLDIDCIDILDLDSIKYEELACGSEGANDFAPRAIKI